MPKMNTLARRSEIERRIAEASAKRARKLQLVVPWAELMHANPAMDFCQRLSIRVTTIGADHPTVDEQTYEIRPVYTAQNGDTVRIKIELAHADTGIEADPSIYGIPAIERIIDGIAEHKVPADVRIVHDASNSGAAPWATRVPSIKVTRVDHEHEEEGRRYTALPHPGLRRK
jgi:hypothetical protein